MDPNQLLADLRLAAKIALVEIDNGESLGEVSASLETLASGFLSLDEWIRKGGFLPREWQQN